MNKLKTLTTIKEFLDGYNNDLKYIVNVEADSNSNIAKCVIHEPNQEKKIIDVKYEPFMYMKDLKKLNRELYKGQSDTFIRSMQIMYGVTITELKTGNQKRLSDGYCYKLTSSKSYYDIVNYIKKGGIDIFEKAKGKNGKFIKNKAGEYSYPNRDLFFSVKAAEQFFISTKSRLFKGIEEYKDVHRLTLDIETTGLRYQMARIFSIGVRDNRGNEMILEVDKENDDESEARVIQDLFNMIFLLKPAVILGHNLENFDFDFILGRANIIKMDLNAIPTSLKKDIPLKRKPRTPVKYGNTPDRYTSTVMWGYSVIDTLHAAKRTAAINSEIKATGLKYIAKHEKLAKPDRTYIKGEDNSIGIYYKENKVFAINDKNEYIQVPDDFQDIAFKLHKLNSRKDELKDDLYKKYRKDYLDGNPEFVSWFKEEALPKGMNKFIGGKKLVKNYLLDDLWETEQVDELYNQSSFMTAKIVPTTYQRICTMGTAGIWNLLLTAWSYENDIAIPIPDKSINFSGGLSRCYKTGFSTRIKKIDYASLYPMIQLEDDVFPMFDITGVIKNMLLYLTTTRNIYKKLGNGDELNEEEIALLKEIDHEVYLKFLDKSFTGADIALFKIKQLPIKILNNSLYGALGAAISFNWSDNICASRITCSGRLHLRHAVRWFSDYDCTALLAVTDGINFSYPYTTKIRVTDDGVSVEEVEQPIEEMWKYGNKVGLNALIKKFNQEEMRTKYMSVDDDGDSISCLNLARINYASLMEVKDKKTGEMVKKVKFTGNTIKSKVMPEYIEEFIDKGLRMILDGEGNNFVKYYHDYCDEIRYMRIPLKKIANKSKIKIKFEKYRNRGKNKKGEDKAMQAHMELLIEQRNNLIEELFEKHKDSFNIPDLSTITTVESKLKFVSDYMPPEPELDSIVYYYNNGYVKSHGDSRRIIDKETKKERFCAVLINNNDLQENPNMLGVYNYAKYLSNFNKRVETLLVGFNPEIRDKILVKVTKTGELKKELFTEKQTALGAFDLDGLDDSMYLEPMEVEFWNKTGFDPRKIWNGFKVYDDDKIYYEIYDNALNFLNEKMKLANKPLIKSINDKYEKDDLVLIKDGSEFRLGEYNGVYMQIIREVISDIPKSEYELELERKHEENEKKIEKLKGIKEEKLPQLSLEDIERDRNYKKYFKKFCKEFKLENIFKEVNDLLLNDEAKLMFEQYIEFLENKSEESENDEPIDFDTDYE